MGGSYDHDFVYDRRICLSLPWAKYEMRQLLGQRVCDDRVPGLLHTVLLSASGNELQLRMPRDLSYNPKLAVPPKLRAAGLNIVLELITVEVSEALRQAGARTILLKGPVLARWLYDHNEVRSYADVDMLVASHHRLLAQETISGLGFTMEPGDLLRTDPPAYAQSWVRARDGATVELHGMLLGVGVGTAELWSVLTSATERMVLRGAEVEILNAAGRAFHIALHAAQHGADWARPLDDLARALQRVPRGTWRDAAALAVRLEATESFAAGLRLLPAGMGLAKELLLPAVTSTEVALRAASAPTGAKTIERLATTPGVRSKTLMIMNKVVPPADFMRAWSPLGRRGRVGLVAAYLWRPLWLLARSASAVSEWRRVRKLVNRHRDP